ncbi:hypothetical protein EV421DRAFT_1907970 [Armillaria borealis]|uniref:Uncharacterized protein n=1 Tax=Armillaria borealis TaxID=47425 RepID=A0AA39MJP4_9AGAR|nr:hypothetical protein EV421DRAFT_1907970 [Armillaria borealis]
MPSCEDAEYFSELFFTSEELDGVHGLGGSPPVILTGFKEDDLYLKAKNDIKRGLLPGDSGMGGQYYVVLNGSTCGVHRKWYAMSMAVLTFADASFYRALSHPDAEKGWKDVWLEKHVGLHQPLLHPPPSSPYHSTASQTVQDSNKEQTFYWVVTSGFHPGIFPGINDARLAGADMNESWKAFISIEQACMSFVEAFMDEDR